jgi:uncharacterized membrane protein
LLLRERYGRRHVGHALLFLGTVLFGASVFLVGQMYNVDAHDPLAFLLWALGALAIAAVARSGPIAALGFGSLFAWTVHEVFHAEHEFFDAIVVIPGYMALYGVALYGLGLGAARWLEPRRFTRPMSYLGVAFLGLGTLPFTFRDAHEFAQFDEALEVDRIDQIFVGLAVAAGIGVVALPLLRLRHRRTAVFESAALAAVVGLVVAAMVAPETTAAAANGNPDAEVTTYPLLFNVAVAVLAFGAVLVGILNDEVWLANSGVALVGIDVLLRFFDDDWTMLQRGVVLMLVGAAVLALTLVLERRRLRTA